MKYEELIAMKEELKSFNSKLWDVSRPIPNHLHKAYDDLCKSCTNLQLIINKRIQEFVYKEEISQEDWEIITNQYNKILIFSNGELNPVIQEFDINKIQEKVVKLNEKNIKDADKIAIFSNGESKTVGRFKRII